MKIVKDTNGESSIVRRRISEVRVVSMAAVIMATGKINQNLLEK
jgi:hypothetical protein